MRRLTKAIIETLDLMGRQYLAKQIKFDDFADDYLIGLISIRYFIGNETYFEIMRKKFSYLISVYETHDSGLPISGFIRPLIDHRYKVEHDMDSPLDYALYLAIYERTPEAETTHYKLAKGIFESWFNKAYADMDFDCDMWPKIIAIMSRFDAFNNLPYEDVRAILLDECDDEFVKTALKGDVERLKGVDLRNPRTWLYVKS